jgi:hypothetical protein
MHARGSAPFGEADEGDARDHEVGRGDRRELGPAVAVERVGEGLTKSGKYMCECHDNRSTLAASPLGDP